MNASCHVGHEFLGSAFAYWFCKDEGAASKVNIGNSLVDVTSLDWIEYNETLFDAAKSCKKACDSYTTFLSCVSDTFCTRASSSVKAMGQAIYTLNEEGVKSGAAAILPYATAAAVGGLAIGGLISFCAPKNSVTTGLSRVFYAIGALGAVQVAWAVSK